MNEVMEQRLVLCESSETREKTNEAKIYYALLLFLVLMALSSNKRAMEIHLVSISRLH